jgi:hypothetical protein
MAVPKNKPNVQQQIAGVIVFTAGSLTLVGLGRKFFLRRGIGPGLRWVYSRVPILRRAVQFSTGDLPLIHELHGGTKAFAETTFTVVFWSLYFFQPETHDFADELFDAFVAGLTLRPIRETIPDAEWVLSNLPRLILGGQSPPRQFDYGDGTAVTSSTGRIAFGTMNAWEADP